MKIYYDAYKMMIESLKSENIYAGLLKVLQRVNKILKSDDVIVYKLNTNNDYDFFAEYPVCSDNYEFVTDALDLVKNKINVNEIMRLDDVNGLSNIVFLQLITINSKYIIGIANMRNNNINSKFFDLLGELMTIVLEKNEFIGKMEKISYSDELTGLGNRYSYNKHINLLNDSSDSYVFALFDLFRLKYVNDNYSHSLGDEYIMRVAELLKKYFPKYNYIEEKKGVFKKISTGSCVYRIGGDEFVLISNLYSLSDVEEKAMMLAEEVKNLKLDVDESLMLGINYGIASRNFNESSRELYLDADKKLSNDKNNMYKVLKIDRRI